MFRSMSLDELAAGGLPILVGMLGLYGAIPAAIQTTAAV